MGELNLDKFERAWILASEQKPKRVMSSLEKKEENISRCSLAVQNEMTKTGRQSKQLISLVIQASSSCLVI
jgi:hypothetical protein